MNNQHSSGTETHKTGKLFVKPRGVFMPGFSDNAIIHEMPKEIRVKRAQDRGFARRVKKINFLSGS